MQTQPTPNQTRNDQKQPLRFIQINCNRSSLVVTTVLELASRTADIILIQEPWISHDGNTITHPTFTTITPSHPTLRARVMTYINNTTQHLTTTPRPDISNDPNLQ